MSVYDESHIQVLNDLEAVRRSAFMYLSTTPTYKLICEIIQNSNDEAQAGRCSRVDVWYDSVHQSIRVLDNGYGIPLGSLKLVITKLNAGGKFNQGSADSPYKRSFGKHGIGLKACNAVSEKFEIWSRRDGKEKYYKFAYGIEKDSYEKEYKGPSGTEVFLTPDKELLQDTYLNKAILLDTLELLAYLTPGFEIYFNYDNEKYHFLVNDGGIEGFYNFYNKKHNVRAYTNNPMSLTLDYPEWSFSCCVAYCTTASESNFGSFCNGFPTRNGGSHVTAIKSGMARALTQYMKKYNSIPKSLEKINITGTAINDYICGIVVLSHDSPIYDGQVKDRLLQPEIVIPITSLVYEGFTQWAENNKKDMDKIVDWCIKVAKAEWEARNIKSKALGAQTVKSTFGANANLTKFTDTNIRNPGRDEIFFVEGDSAGGTLSQARFADFQAIFRLRGKVYNVNSDNTNKLSEELESIVTILECGIGEKKDINKLRFNKIIMLADADDDGAHIAALLLGFFHKYYPEFIENGNIYVAKPPLKRLSIKVGKETHVLDILNDRYSDFYLNELTRYNFELVNGKDDKVIQNQEIFKHFIYGLIEYGIQFDNIISQLSCDPELLELILLNMKDLNEKGKYKVFEQNGFKVTLKDQTNGIKSFEFDKGIHHYYIKIDNNFYHNIYKPLYITLATKVKLKNVYLRSKYNGDIHKGSLYYYSSILRNLFEDSKDVHIQRFKGLGEMDADELKETVTDPETRTLVKVTMDDLQKCKEYVEIFLGRTMPEKKKEYFETIY